MAQQGPHMTWEIESNPNPPGNITTLSAVPERCVREREFTGRRVKLHVGKELPCVLLPANPGNI